MNTASPQLKDTYEMAKRLMFNTKKYFEEYFSVFFVDKLSTGSSFACFNYTIPPMRDKEVDLIIIIELMSDSGNTFAAAGSCLFEPFNGRSMAGVYYLNIENLGENRKINENKYYSVFAHEFTHILFFNPVQYNMFPTTGMNTNQLNPQFQNPFTFLKSKFF